MTSPVERFLRTRATRRAALRAERSEGVADAVYGTILVLAVVAAWSQDEKARAGAILVGALATSLVFWVVHVYANVLSRRAAGESTPLNGLVRRAAQQEWPLVEAAIAPLLPLLLSVLGVLARGTAITLALLVGLADLAIWGYLAGRTLQQSQVKALASAAAAVALGTLMVVLKYVVH